MSGQPLAPEPNAQEWLRFAGEDLKAARKLCGDPDMLPNIVGFHAQQAVEKSIKALLIHAGIRFPFTHDLTELFELYVSLGRPLPFDPAKMDELTPYAAQRRYPGYVHQPGVREQQRLLALAEEVFAWAKSVVSPTD